MTEASTAPEVSASQRRVLDHLLERQARGEIAPTTREIQQALGITSQNSVIQFLRALERKGLVRTLPGKARGVVAISPPDQSPVHLPDIRSSFIEVPLYGEVREAGSPNDPLPLPSILPVHAPTMRLTPRSRPFAWRVRGDSLRHACIQDGDYLIFDAHGEPRPGDMVAVTLDGVSALRRYVVVKDQYYLKVENLSSQDLQPLAASKTQGVMVGLIRGASLA